jgi:flagellar hook-length control protein FliK
MPEGTVLPALVAAPAKVAATAAPERPDAGAPASADGAGGTESFGQVLQSRMSARDGAQNATPSDQRPAASAEESATEVEAPVVAGDTLGLQASVLALLQQQPPTPVDAEGMAVTRELGDVVESARGDRGRGLLPRLVAEEGGVVRDDKSSTDEPGKASGEFRDLVEALGVDASEKRAQRALDPASQELPHEKPALHAEAGASPGMSVGASNAAVQSASSAQGGASPRMTLTVPVSSPAWGDAFSDRMTLALQNRQPVAELHLNPPNLGPVEIQVSMNGDQASLSFFSPHAPVREAIQSAMPRLSEALAESGVSLGNVFVGAQSQQGRNPQDDARGGSRTRNDRSEPVSAVTSPAATRWSGPVASLRAVDLFA